MAATFSIALDFHCSIQNSDNKHTICFTSTIKYPTKRFKNNFCNSLKSPSNSSEPEQSPPQKPLSTTTLSESPKIDQESKTHLLTKPNSTWVNPTKPRPSVLTLNRHKRLTYSYNPHIKHLRLIVKKLNDCSDEAAFMAVLENNPSSLNSDDALLVLNNLKPWQKTLLFFNWIKTQNLFLRDAAVDSRRPFCNCLIDICRNRKLQRRSHELLYLGNVYGLYPGLHTKTSDEWRLNVRSLSVGAAHTALENWMGAVIKIIHQQEALPELFSANTGAGTHKYSQGLANAFASHVNKLNAPFKQSEEKAGFFMATREDLVSWAQSRVQSLTVTA